MPRTTSRLTAVFTCLLAFAPERLPAACDALRAAGALAAPVGRLAAAPDAGPDVVLGAPGAS